MSSAVRAFFTQRKKDLESGGGDGNSAHKDSTAATIERAFGAATAAVAPARRTVHVAVQGCCHGELDRIYAACAEHERDTNKKIDLLVCCGDFQATRDWADLASMAVPDKYKTVGDFPKYFRPVVGPQGDEGGPAEPPPLAPYLTVFVGGNHENSDWLAEESYGGFLAPNIYYLGHSGVVEIDGRLRVAGLSGIFKAMDYMRPYPERRPYGNTQQGGGEGAKRSAYHIRRIEALKLSCYCRAVELIRAGHHGQQRQREKGEEETNSKDTPESAPTTTTTNTTLALPVVDLMVSHDWPAGVTRYGDEGQLLKYKPYFSDEVAHNALGNPHTLALLRRCRPRYWLAAHLHCHFTAKVPHTDGVSSSSSSLSRAATTTFMALDKCAKGKGFLDFLDVPIAAATDETSGTSASAATTTTTATTADEAASEDQSGGRYRRRVRHDSVWLAVLRRSHAYLAANAVIPPGEEGGYRGGGWGFDAEAEAAAIAQVFLSGGEGKEKEEGPLSAVNTASLLAALGLEPVVPLQLPLTGPRIAQQQQQRRSAAPPATNPRYPQPPSGIFFAEDLGNSGGPTAAPLESVGWAEDLG